MANIDFIRTEQFSIHGTLKLQPIVLSSTEQNVPMGAKVFLFFNFQSIQSFCLIQIEFSPTELNQYDVVNLYHCSRVKLRSCNHITEMDTLL